MKSSRFLLASLVLLLVCGTAQAQFGKRLGKAVENAAKNATVRKAEQKTEEAVGKTIDKATDPDTYKDKNGNIVETPDSGVSTGQPQKGVKAAEMAYAKSDFVPGDEIIFSDDLANEQLGEFPSQWDLLNGNAEVASIDGLKCINLEAGSTSTVAPLIKDMKSYLPDVFTIELDYWVNNFTETNKMPSQNYTLHLLDEKGSDVISLQFAEGRVNWNYKTSSGEIRNGNVDWKEKIDSWSHLAVSFNKRAFKAYINGVRVVNIPNMAAPKSMKINNSHWSDHRTAITNVRIAKGAVPLYDRMMSDGKFITYGITFDVGKSTIKPESMGEINRIAKLMQDNPGLKFSVEGHTDSTGSAATNQKLSDERSAAVVAKLVEMGVSKDRLKSAGKGQSSPIADNGTDEGRAKNRRVEFVKL
ncbi:MAG: OmpA family protein [Prevotellaceae bacterium]|nr:OmpA family protein [Prevotellaceae bacterium]